MTTLSLEPRVFLIERFVSDDECARLRDAAEPRLIDSKGLERGQDVKIAARTSQQAWLKCEEHAFVCDIDERIAKTTRIPLAHVQQHVDPLQVIRYGQNEHYHSHHDFFDPTLHPATPGLREGYNRMITLLWYLSDVEEGGETVFPLTGDNAYANEADVTMSDCTRGLRVKPKRGAALLWYNMLPEGNGHEARPDRLSLHGGCSVKAGVKWGANKWIYNHKWDKRHWLDTERDGTARVVDMPAQPKYPKFTPDESVAAPDGSMSVRFLNAHARDLQLYWVDATSNAESSMGELRDGAEVRQSSAQRAP